ncbi:elongation factor P--(R)-beta-lysine ligase [Celerinatantimonas diazotrophica]|uniref:Lysyl-tRNA synthetase class 2 n=1 Tax=Celerinatantimonas diazotrophica TaxID=412034 RepID=A0A4R1K1Q2_9GAMM|nr:elongation factor P--(R)-beta-lysine ligase [Celerinatantimonas diazotrophica]TCK57936.1 lysyl-tRNA synthetase class 2 [Celerinatantimonas diazotrophica]CAG9297996.1 Elongation factor P--(R)-beta-lysine ligase [Celerinatantimonas diazotrophica]
MSNQAAVYSANWQPSASIQVLRQRAKLLQSIRSFFSERNVLEVETPALSQYGVSDLHLRNFETQFVGPGAADGKTLYLQTSPEFHMKRLLASGSGAIYQICKSFRNEEAGRIHNPEFTMLEWYRPGFNHQQLMDEMDQLLMRLLKCDPGERMSYQHAFMQYLGIDPLSASREQIIQAGKTFAIEQLLCEEHNRDSQLQILFALGVEPNIGRERPCFIDLFPASQAALARVSPDDTRVAERFEVYFKGVELANGFHELSDAQEQRTRFERDNQLRAENNLPVMTLDENLLSALGAGLPDCSGVALGLDRVFMLALEKSELSDVVSFGIERA